MPNENEISLEGQTAQIVAAYLRHNQLSADQVPSLISNVHQALGNLGNAPEAVVERIPAVPVRRSVHQDYVICLDCGWRGKMLRRHVGTAHGLSPTEYRGRWNLSPEHPLTAPGYSEQRSGLAKQLGLGRHRERGEGTASPEPEARKGPKKRSKRRGSAAST
jgi:predicted transcriptional regulator